MTNFHWMIFQPEGLDILYLWNGTFPNLIHVPVHEGLEAPWYWNGVGAKELRESEIKLLNEVAATKRKNIFKYPGKDRRFVVITRGVYEYQNDNR